eukprot:504310-Prorocentrum_minimum.AAC.3
MNFSLPPRDWCPLRIHFPLRRWERRFSGLSLRRIWYRYIHPVAPLRLVPVQVCTRWLPFRTLFGGYGFRVSPACAPRAPRAPLTAPPRGRAPAWPAPAGAWPPPPAPVPPPPSPPPPARQGRQGCRHIRHKRVTQARDTFVTS